MLQRTWKAEAYLAGLGVAPGSHTAPPGGCGGLQGQALAQLLCCHWTLQHQTEHWAKEAEFMQKGFESTGSSLRDNTQ